VDLSLSNGSTARLHVALVITPPGVSTLKAAAKQQAACTPNQTVPVFTGLGGGGTPLSGQAQAITVQVVDDCGNPVNRGNVVTTFQGTNSQQTPMQNVNGVWSGTWTPLETTSSANVTATVTATTESGVSGSVSEPVPLEPNPNPPPVVFDNGVVNSASFDGEPLAPGTIVSLFGSALSSATLASGGLGAKSLPLPAELGNTRVTVAGQPLPLLFVREDQVNGILPFELGDRATEALPLVVQRTDSGALSTAVPLSLSAARPGAFTQTGTGSGPASVLDARFRLVTEANPVRPGDVIQVFATGLGLTDRPVVTADAAPADPLARAAENVRATIAGLDAQVVFAGLSPGFAGLYQINLVVPSGVPQGSAELVIFAADQPSRTATVAIAAP
jgi:uncharacterized protein (TIGR03437 family)